MASTQLLQFRLRLLQPVRHPHFAVHRRRGGEVVARVLALADAPGELAEAEVAVGDERAHAELAGEHQRLAGVAFSGLSDAYALLAHYGVLAPSDVWSKAAS